jgi:hypothetical protein
MNANLDANAITSANLLDSSPARVTLGRRKA